MSVPFLNPLIINFETFLSQMGMITLKISQLIFSLLSSFRCEFRDITLIPPKKKHVKQEPTGIMHN